MRYILSFFLLSQFIYSQKNSKLSQEKWVDSVYNQFSFDEKVGQLFMVAAYSNKTKHIISLLMN